MFKELFFQFLKLKILKKKTKIVNLVFTLLSVDLKFLSTLNIKISKNGVDRSAESAYFVQRLTKWPQALAQFFLNSARLLVHVTHRTLERNPLSIFVPKMKPLSRTTAANAQSSDKFIMTCLKRNF